MNCQAICDVRSRFLDLSIMYPGSTSDCLAFEGMTLFPKLENSVLAPGLCLFGDNAYINCHFMATPFSGNAGGSKDAYNFYHSQLQIQIECAFGILTSRWAILRKALPANITIKRGVALVVELTRLHNFCIDETDAKANVDSLDTTSCVVPALALPARDELDIEQEGAVPVDPTPEQLLHGGQHFDNVDVRYSTLTMLMCATHNAQHGVPPEQAMHYCKTSLAIAYTPWSLMPTSLAQVRNNSITTNHY
jgi:hypothetical protein